MELLNSNMNHLNKSQLVPELLQVAVHLGLPLAEGQPQLVDLILLSAAC